jgi:hypothetical protein
MAARSLITLVVVAVSACATLPAAPSRHEPSSADSGPQIAAFDLRCRSHVPGQDDIWFRIGRADDGSAVATTMNDTPLVAYSTHTYMNAYMWTNGTERYVVDRMSGVLSVKPSGKTYDCERLGGQRF